MQAPACADFHLELRLELFNARRMKKNFLCFKLKFLFKCFMSWNFNSSSGPDEFPHSMLIKLNFKVEIKSKKRDVAWLVSLIIDKENFRSHFNPTKQHQHYLDENWKFMKNIQLIPRFRRSNPNLLLSLNRSWALKYSTDSLGRYASDVGNHLNVFFLFWCFKRDNRISWLCVSQFDAMKNFLHPMKLKPKRAPTLFHNF